MELEGEFLKFESSSDEEDINLPPQNKEIKDNKKITPWVKTSKKIPHTGLRMHKEIMELFNFIKPKNEDNKRRNGVLKELRLNIQVTLTFFNFKRNKKIFVFLIKIFSFNKSFHIITKANLSKR